MKKTNGGLSVIGSLKQKSGPAFATLAIVALLFSASGIKVSQATNNNNDNENENCGQPSVSLNVQNSEHEDDNDNEDCKVKVVINKVWQNADGVKVSAPENKGDITITVAFGNNKTTNCTYVGDTLKCGKKIEVKAPSTIHITETGLPAGWEVVTSTIGDVSITDCSPNDTFTKHEGDDDDDNNKPTCTHTVINRMLPVDPCLNQIPPEQEHVSHILTDVSDIAIPQCAPKLHFIKVVCDAYGDVSGNEDANLIDDTNGHFGEFNNNNNGTFVPPLVNGMVNPYEIPGSESGCARADGWKFDLANNGDLTGPSAQEVGPTVNGEFVTPISGLNSELNLLNQTAIVSGQLWVAEQEKKAGYDFAAIRCYKDALNGDNLEYISLGQSRPNDIYCIAYNIQKPTPPPTCLQDELKTVDAIVDNESSCITTVEGNKFEDVNGNGTWDAGENPLAGWTITAYNHTNGDSFIDSDVTNANGLYHLDIPTNNDVEVVISETPQPGWIQTAPTTVTPPGVWNLSLAAGGEQQLGGDHIIPGYNFGNMRHVTEPCGTELIVNGGFEVPAIEGGWDIVNNGTDGLGWSVEWMPSIPDGAPDPASVELHRGVNGWLSQEGQQHAELDGDWGGPSSGQSGEDGSTKIYQTLSTVPGSEYTISYWTSPRPGIADNQVRFSWNGSPVETIVEDGSANGQTVWTKHTHTLTATGSTTVIEFADLSAGDSLGSFIDNVSVKEVCSEPCSEEPVSVNLISDTTDMTAGFTEVNPSADKLNPLSYQHALTNAVLTQYIGAWVNPDVQPGLMGSGAKWISSQFLHPGDVTGEGNPASNQWRLFHKSFNVPAGATVTAGTIYFSADNAMTVYLNGIKIAETDPIVPTFGDTPDPLPGLFNTVYSATFTPAVGNNSLEFVVRNSSGNYTYNPTGMVYHADFSYTPDCTPPSGGGNGGSGGSGDGGSRSSGGSGGGTPQVPEVKGDSTTLPSDPIPEILGASTELPRTGIPAQALIALLGLASLPLLAGRKIQLEK